jgi:transcriptional regulator with XRE-family HTH domain
MTEHPISGPMSMVKVDGAKIKHLRESQGLTQLYLATAVQVTTDTISRWENKKYPTIKKENGVKLAEALNVELDELLLVEEVTTVNESSAATSPVEEISPLSSPQPQYTSSSKRMIMGLLAIGVFFFCGYALWHSLTPPPDPLIFAERDLPHHGIPGQPFPVLIRVTGITADNPATVIIKENLPTGAKIVKIAPDNSGGAMKKETVKWLKKIDGPTTFAYVATITGEENSTFAFSGNASVSGDFSTPADVAGNNSILLGAFHWADTDQDGRINDNEILAVHERYKEIEGIDVDIQTIEAIWLGSGYSWNPKTKSFKIRE